MGTRGAFGFYIDGATKVAYNHFDSYPEGLGDDLVSYIREMVQGLPENPDLLLAKVRALQAVPQREPTAEEIERLAPWTDLNVSEKSPKDWYCLLRKVQGDVTAMLESGFYDDAESFMSDSLFCEWAYIINFDAEVFEVYKGFQKKPHTKGRYAGAKDADSEYEPVALVASFPLTAIPEDWKNVVADADEEDADEGDDA